MNYSINGFYEKAICGLQTLSNNDEGASSRVVTATAVCALGLLGAWLLHRREEPSRKPSNCYLSGCRLTAPPDIRNNPQLSNLNLSRNQLEVSPDVRNNPWLEVFDLGFNRLKESPDVSRNPRLQTLDLSNNQLKISSDVSRNPQLQTLNLPFNQLNDPPDISKNPLLQRLNISHNPLSASPDLRNNPRLEILDLSFTRLGVPPDLRNNPRLEILNLSSNRLEVPPIVSGNPHLKNLNLSCNHLREAPDLTGNTRLENLNLSLNQLTSLPDSILTLPRNCRVLAENNNFTPEYVAEFQERLRQHQLQHPDQGPSVTISAAPVDPQNERPVSLDEQLASWSAEFAIAFPQSTNGELSGPRPTINTLMLSDSDAQLLANYLEKLRGVADYRAGGQARKNITFRVEQMLQLACKNEHFRKNILKLISDALTSCHDGAITIFNDIEIESKFNDKKLNDEEFRKLAISAQRYEFLKEHAVIVGTKLGLQDQVETVLYYHIHLRDALDLPISTEGMLYPVNAGVTPEMLRTAKKEILSIPEEVLLANSKHWNERMQQLHTADVDRLDGEYQGLLESAAEYFSLPDPEMGQQFLQANPHFDELLRRAESEGARKEYYAIVEYIVAERMQAVARLGTVQ